MIELFSTDSDYVQQSVHALHNMDIASSIQLTVARHLDGRYTADLGRMVVAPVSLTAVHLGTLPDVPPGQRRATWLLTDAVNLALTNLDAHSLLHW